MRLVKNRCEQEVAQSASPEPQFEQVSFTKLMSLTDKKTKIMLWAGWVFAALTGMIFPVFLWMVGDVFDAFSQEKKREETLDEIWGFFYVMVGLSIALTFTATVYHSFLAHASANIYASI